VVEKFVMQLEAQLSERGVIFELSDEAISWLADRGYDEKMGARPLGRVIQEYIKKPLADEVLFGKLKKGGTVKVTVEKDELGETKLKLESVADEPRAKPKRQTRKPAAKKKPVPVKAVAVASDVVDADEVPAPKSKPSVPKIPRK
ncbi:MAG: ATP-dependent Clp protease ATP-binding subunit ClpA, partial [Oricola sp.]